MARGTPKGKTVEPGPTGPAAGEAAAPAPQGIPAGDVSVGTPPPPDKPTKALEFFKDWTNYLLVTTVAAIGWVAEKGIIANHPKLRFWCLLALGLSAVFGILTQALVPLVQEQRKDGVSNYQVPVTFWFWPKLVRLWSKPMRLWPKLGRWIPANWNEGMRLTWMCFPQHVLLIIGILLYVYAAFPKF